MFKENSPRGAMCDALKFSHIVNPFSQHHSQVQKSKFFFHSTAIFTRRSAPFACTKSDKIRHTKFLAAFQQRGSKKFEAGAKIQHHA